ncbi:uncharacterized protein LOC129216684 [Uloborus diversus]|uniref:uncharacterized protein LOC129216684 n=1 Tax=Uloborus diversus TaxID=327109 RepID=UPI00240A4933|nr:uncharacterized protein LOC129216684 [Uloborus diversus]
MDKGLTGLEPKVENLQQLHETIADAAGEETPKKMGESFKDEAREKEEEADLSEVAKSEAQESLDSCLALVRSLHKKCFPDDASSSDEIDDRNTMDVLENIEKHILEQLMLIEYKRTIEASDEDLPPAVSETDEPNIDEPEVTDSADLIQPRLLKSEIELPILNDLKRRTSVLSLDDLKQMAVDVLSKLGSEGSRDDDVEEDSAKSDK